MFHRLAQLTVTAAVVLAALAGIGCADGGDNADATPSSPVSGLLTDLETDDQDQTTAITLRADGGGTFEFEVVFESGQTVSAEHLREHIDLMEPVTVYFIEDGGRLLAHRIDDAVPHE